MKTIITALMSMMIMGASAQEVKLPAHNLKQQSMNVVEALNTRHSVRQYSSQKLTLQELSDLCWAACGVSRDAEHRTAPTAMNKKEIRLYVFTEKAAYEYLPNKNVLKTIVKGDNRKLIAGNKNFSQDFVLQAPVSLLMVIDFEKFGSQDERAMMMGCVDAGIVSENINLYCQAVGLCTVPRATHDTEALRKLLGLSEKQLPIMNNPVGFPK